MFLGLKRFQCDTCKKQFGFKKDLINHLRTHTGDRPFTCDICGKDFAHDSSLKLHKKTHVREEDIPSENFRNTDITEEVVETDFVKIEEFDQKLTTDENDLGIEIKHELTE